MTELIIPNGWSTNAPTEEGFYWLKMHHPISGERSGLTVVSVQKRPDGRLVACFHADEYTPRAGELQNVEWLGPLHRPE